MKAHKDMLKDIRGELEWLTDLHTRNALIGDRKGGPRADVSLGVCSFCPRFFSVVKHQIFVQWCHVFVCTIYIHVCVCVCVCGPRAGGQQDGPDLQTRDG